MSLLKFLGLGGTVEPQDIEGVRTIVDALDTLEPDRARHLAGFAYILAESHTSISMSVRRKPQRLNVSWHGKDTCPTDRRSSS